MLGASLHCAVCTHAALVASDDVNDDVNVPRGIDITSGIISGMPLPTPLDASVRLGRQLLS